MFRRLPSAALLLAALLAVLLSACQGSTAPGAANLASPTALNNQPGEAYSPTITGITQAPAATTGAAETAVTETTVAGTAPTATGAANPGAGSANPAGCTVVSAQPTAGPTEQSLFPAPTEKDWSQGPASARFTILEYSDFQ